MTESPEEWTDMALDSRLLESIKDLKWTQPTTVQKVCIPLALKGSDVSIQSRTGSGKTGAFVIPLLQRIIAEREMRGRRDAGSNPVGLFLLPTVELCEQITEATNELAKFVKPRVVVDNVTSGGPVTTARLQACHIVVTTVALLAKACRSGAVDAAALQGLRYAVIDEADMIMSIAENSLKVVRSVLPTSLQVILCSATLTDGVASLKGHLLHNAKSVVITLEDTAGDDARADGGALMERRVTLKDTSENKLKQFYLVATDDCHQNTLIFSLYRFSLLEGKTLIFVNEEDTTYRLQNFLEQLGVATLVYDSTLPMNVRLDTLKRFQRGQVSTLICTDGTLASAEQEQMGLAGAEEEEGAAAATGRPRKSRRLESSSAPPSSLHRGIDFSNVRNVIIFDGVDANSPLALSRYTHRIGRAARGGQEGMSITIFSIAQARTHLHLLKEYCVSRGERILPFKRLQRADAAKLQYRVDSVLSNITRTSTRKLRVSTVAAELSRSAYLANHMSQKDTDALRRVVRRSQRKVKIERDLLEVPRYMKIRQVDDVKTYAKRVRSSETRESKFRKIARGEQVDPLKLVVDNLRKKGKKK